MSATSTRTTRPSRGRVRYLLGYLLLVVVPVLAAGAVVARVSADSSVDTSVGAARSALAQGSRLFLALAVLLLVIRICGVLGRRLGQPLVVGEIVAGIALGPSLLGRLAPEVQGWLFPPTLLPAADTLAQLGVVFFMFLVGRELPLDLLRRSGGKAAALAQASTAVPFLIGILLAVNLPGGYRPPGVPTLAFVLFVGVAFAVTAFPVLARVLSEQRLTGTPLGTLGLATAGIGDVLAWCLLAAVTAIAGRSSIAPAVLSCALVIIYGLLMVTVARPLLAAALPRIERAGQGAVAVTLLCVVLISAWLTDSIGAHAIFGAFVAGLITPRGSAAADLVVSRIEGLTMWLLLPVFFVVIGLKLDLGSVGGLTQWALLLLIVVLASVGKFGGVTLLARLLGNRWRSAAGLGLMMNCRGVTELVVLQIGLTLGVLPPRMFAMLTCMALITTAATGPLLSRLHLPVFTPPEPAADPAAGPSSALISSGSAR